MPTKKSTMRAEAPEKERRKPEDDRKDLLLRVRVTAAQKQILTKAAERAGLDVSSWLRAVGIERARELGVDQ
jgi:uncharacterized protein (DUF1778 family)